MIYHVTDPATSRLYLLFVTFNLQAHWPLSDLIKKQIYFPHPQVRHNWMSVCSKCFDSV